MAKKSVRRNILANVGKQRLGRVVYDSDPAFFDAMQASSKAITDALLGILKGMEDVSEDIILEALEPTFEKAKMYCPKDTHALVNSAYLEKVGFRGRPRVEIGFARGGFPHYAAVVHEALEFKHASPTRAKFLEQAVMEDLDAIRDRIAAGYREFMNG